MMKSKCVSCFKNLSVESRYKIYDYILKSKTGLNESQITSVVNLSQPTVSYHLKAMVKSGLLTVKTIERFSYFSVNPDCPHDGHACILRNQKP